MEPQITQNTQMAWCLQGQDDAFDLAARPAEIEKQAEVQAGGFQIIQALRAMNLVDRFHRFQFDEDDALDKQINGIFTDHDPIVSNDHWMLLRDRESRLAQLVQPCVFMDLLEKFASSVCSTVRAQPMMRFDSRSTPSASASVCVFCVFCGSIPLILGVLCDDRCKLLAFAHKKFVTIFSGRHLLHCHGLADRIHNHLSGGPNWPSVSSAASRT
jgi:hypothetical protein